MEIENLLLSKIKERNVTDKKVIAMIMAQCYVESMDFKRLEESFSYTAERLHEVFGRYFKTMDSARFAANKGSAYIANIVYADRMGNGNFESGDGYKYRGRGLIQLTGKDNYAHATLSLDIDLLSCPELLLLPDNAVNSALWFISNQLGFMKAASVGDVEACTRMINGGLNGLAERVIAYNKYMVHI